MPRILFTAGAVVCAALVLPGAADRGVSFEQRVAAQRVLDRLRHSHLEGSKTPFEQAVPGALTERRVRTQLQESVALEQFWKTTITPEMLQREMERIAESTLFPDRLLEIYAAFDHDPVLVQEALARPALVERLTRDFFASDERIHGEARAEAERLRESLLGSPAAEPVKPDGGTTLRIVELVREVERAGTAGASPGLQGTQNAGVSRHRVDRHDGEPGIQQLSLASGEYDAERRLAPSRVGDVGEVVEERDAFVMRRVISEDKTSPRIAVYSVPKVPWHSWWKTVQGSFPESNGLSVARSTARLPRPTSEANGRGGPRRPGRGDPLDDPLSFACPPDDTWDTQSFQVLPRAMSGHQAIWSGREMIVWGGKQAGGFRYDPLINSWRGMSLEGAPEKGTAVWTDQEMIVWDGEARNGARYDPVTDVWRPMASIGSPSPRSSFAAIWTGREVIVWGGTRDLYNGLNSGARYDPLIDRWTPISNRDLPSARSSPRLFWTGKEMLVWGGVAYPPEAALYDPATDRWRQISMNEGPKNSNAHAVWAGTELVAWGTYFVNNGYRSFAVRYDPAVDKWTPVSPDYVGWLNQYIPLAWTGEEIILWSDHHGAAAFKPKSEGWRTISTVNAVTQRGFSTVWTGSHLILWGGGTAKGARYDPASDSWTPTAVPAGPSPAHRMAVWTGNEIIVMGGGPGASRYDALRAQWRGVAPHDALSYHSDGIWTGKTLIVYDGATGGRYDPLTDEWLPMSQDNFPIRSHYWSLVWTGREMILFGGHEDDRGDPRYGDRTSRYDPVADRWTQTSFDWQATDHTWGPPVRDRHAAIWTGTEMVIWGGSRDWWQDEELEGGRFDPETGLWSRLNVSSAPLGDQRAFWTGQEMIVWPRGSSIGKPATYDPRHDSWSSLSTRDAPEVWWGQTVAWAGDYLVVWGAWDNQRNTGVRAGSRYDPRTDTWTPISTRNAPSPGGSAVWTGNGLVLWGGQTATPLGPGSGVYAIAPDLDRDGATTCAGDCNDRNALIHMGAPDIPGNYTDENCDGAVSCDPSSGWSSEELFVRCVTKECVRLSGEGKIPRRECADVIARAKDRASCGNGVIDPHEICDGAVVSETCADRGFDAGALYCNLTCDGYNVSGCTSICGDEARRGFEACDGPDLGGATCASLGYDEGTLACHPSCGGFDHAGCASVCGDGVRGSREACDGDDFGGRSCDSFGFDQGVLACSAGCDRIDTDGCSTLCGDGLRRGMEICDGDDLGEETCLTRGFDSGSLGCNDTCYDFDVVRCHDCGDGVRQETETCDMSDLGGESCATQGFEAGELICNGACNGFETYDCMGCGNDRVELDEECDGGYSGKDTCQARGFNFGWLGCDDNCRIDASACTQCGNGVREYNENCDGTDHDGRTCRTFGFDSGDLGCDAGCRFEFTQCSTVCGDGVRRGGETCDGADLGWYRCWAFGFNAGTLGCSATCDGFDTSSCHQSICGDGVVDTHEQCEQGNLNGQSCEGLGYGGGTLACNEWCGLDESSCIQCGNGVREAGELCDREDVGDATCEMQGYPPGGELICNDTCDGYLTWGCAGCGDNERDWPEQCDGTWLSGRTCESFGFRSGTLACNSDCGGFDFSGCSSVCGDEVRHRTEECDGADFDNATCGSLGFSGGLLVCSPACHLDTSSCTVCGDGTIDGREECEGVDLNGQTCSSLGFTDGVLRCDAACHLDTTSCRLCGDNFLEPPELCDGFVVGTINCRAFGYDGGDLYCNGTCDGYNVSGCTKCGNEVRDQGEVCDGADLDGQTCGSLTGGSGTLACKTDCFEFDVSGCGNP